MDERNGLVSGVCYDPAAKTLIIVFDKERVALNSHALPGGMVEIGETPEQAMRREWSEEVGAEIRSLKRIISRSRKGGEFNHYFFKIELANPWVPLRMDGFSEETGPPIRVLLQDVILGKVEMHYSHRKGLCLTLKKEVMQIAGENINVAFALIDLGIGLKR